MIKDPPTSLFGKLNALKKTTIITAGFAVLILLGKLFGFFDFVGGNDGYYRQNYGQEFLDYFHPS